VPPTSSPTPTPLIEVLQGGVTLTDGSTSVDFGGVEIGAAAPTRTFTVHNPGNGELTLGPPVLPAGFVLTEGLNPTLAPGTSDDFTLAMDTGSAASRSGDVSFATNVAAQNPFNFMAVGTVSPKLAVGGAPGSEDGPAAAAPAVVGPLSIVVDGSPLASLIVGGTAKAKGKVILVVTNTTNVPVSGKLSGSILASTNGLAEAGGPDDRQGCQDPEAEGGSDAVRRRPSEDRPARGGRGP